MIKFITLSVSLFLLSSCSGNVKKELFDIKKIGMGKTDVGQPTCLFRVKVTNNARGVLRRLNGNIIYYDQSGNQVGSGDVYEKFNLPRGKTATFLNHVEFSRNGKEVCNTKVRGEYRR